MSPPAVRLGHFFPLGLLCELCAETVRFNMQIKKWSRYTFTLAVRRRPLALRAAQGPGCVAKVGTHLANTTKWMKEEKN